MFWYKVSKYSYFETKFLKGKNFMQALTKDEKSSFAQPCPDSSENRSAAKVVTNSRKQLFNFTSSAQAPLKKIFKYQALQCSIIE
jgi:hypothetical protein